MTKLKTISMAVGLVLAVGVVSVAAHSQNQTKADKVLMFKGGGWLLPSCTLIIERTGNNVVYRVPSETRAHFKGTWPVQPGVVSVTNGVQSGFQNAMDDDSSTVTESLDVTFVQVGDRLVPINYVYHNWVAARANVLMANPTSCPISPVN